MVYAVIALVIRLLLAFKLWKTGRLALSARTRTGGRFIELVCAVSIFFGFFVYPFTLILLIHLGIRMWTNRKSRVGLGRDPLLFLLTLIIFAKGPGLFSIDRLLGNI